MFKVNNKENRKTLFWPLNIFQVEHVFCSRVSIFDFTETIVYRDR